MAIVDRLSESSILGNSHWEWATACMVMLVSAFVGVSVRRLLRNQYARLVRTEESEIMEVPLQLASRTATLFIVVLSIAAGLATLELPAKPARAVASAATIAVFVQLGLWATTALLALLERRKKSALHEDRSAVGSLGIIGFVLRGIVWALVVLLVLDNLGIDVTALVAGLGVGGIAVALAVQNVLGDLFASLSITLDKPFVIGDFLVVGDFMGTVEHIGIKSVRLRSLSGEQIVISNADLLGSRVRNFGRMVERRVLFTLGVTYETPRVKLQKIPELVRQVIEQELETRFDRSHFAKIADFALEFETVYYVLSPDYNRHMDIQQRIFFAVHAAFERESIEFAYPTRKLWVSSVEPAGARRPAEEATGGNGALRA
jgi:small-conductance mechanosensitive channel